MLLLDNVTQHDFEYILDRFGAVGFERDSGRCSRRLEDLPAGGPVKLVVPRKPLVARQEYVQLDVAVVVGSTAYVGELVDELGDPDVAHLAITAAKIRAAVQGGESPDLAAALRGVTHLKLFLCGLAVRPGLAVDELAQFAAPVGVSLVLPSGQGLGLAAEPAPADPL